MRKALARVNSRAAQAVALALLYFGLASRTQEFFSAEVVEVTTENSSVLPGGKEADGIAGDFVLRNAYVHALISGSQPLRRANMRTENLFVTQGCLYDLDFRGADNDQITAFRPGQAGGEVSFVRGLTLDGGAAAVESVCTAAKCAGVYRRHEYRLHADWRHILVTSTYRNESSAPVQLSPNPAWRGFEDSREWSVDGIRVADSTDPFDKRAYAWSYIPGYAPDKATVMLHPGQDRSFQIALIVAPSPLAAYGSMRALFGSMGRVTGRVLDTAGEPAVHATVYAEFDGVTLPGYPDNQGHFDFPMPAGTYRLTVEDLGRPRLERTLSLATGAVVRENFVLPVASGIRVSVKDETGAPSPAKVQFLGIGGTETPHLGTPYRAHGSDHQFFTHDGTVLQQLPPGRYQVRISRGPEFEIKTHNAEVTAAKIARLEITLRRVVDTRGWISTDFHSHSTPSGDNYCNTRDRLINLAAEHIEFAPATEHNRFYDWQPYIEMLGLRGLLKTAVGIEFTSNGAHLNGFPFQADPLIQDRGAPVYDPDLRISALRLRGWVTPSLYANGSRHDTYQNSRAGVPLRPQPERWVQWNHPNTDTLLLTDEFGGVQDGSRSGLEKLFDGAELAGPHILSLKPYVEDTSRDKKRTLPNRTFRWLQLLNQGRRLWCVAVSDAHRVFGSGVGGWRTYVPSSTDDPQAISVSEIVRNAKAGQMILTNGPFLEVLAHRRPVGSTVQGSVVKLDIKVQAPSWMTINRVQVLVSGRQPEDLNYTREKHPQVFRQGTLRFGETVSVRLRRDEHLIVVAAGEGSDLSVLWGRSSQAQMVPVAFTNPIFVDVDGNGFQAHGDTLGHPLGGPSER
jgi:hypothetical protein